MLVSQSNPVGADHEAGNLHGLHRIGSPVTAVEDERGITHKVILEPNAALAGATACNARFTTGEVIVTMGAGRRFMLRPERMAKTKAEVTCMACIAESLSYDEA
jgi:hypothetical protein